MNLASELLLLLLGNDRASELAAEGLQSTAAHQRHQRLGRLCLATARATSRPLTAACQMLYSLFALGCIGLGFI